MFNCYCGCSPTTVTCCTDSAALQAARSGCPEQQLNQCQLRPGGAGNRRATSRRPGCRQAAAYKLPSAAVSALQGDELRLPQYSPSAPAVHPANAGVVQCDGCCEHPPLTPSPPRHRNGARPVPQLRWIPRHTRRLRPLATAGPRAACRRRRAASSERGGQREPTAGAAGPSPRSGCPGSWVAAAARRTARGRWSPARRSPRNPCHLRQNGLLIYSTAPCVMTFPQPILAATASCRAPERR